MARMVNAMMAQREGLSPRKAMGMGKIPAMKGGGRAKMVKDKDDDGYKGGGKVKRAKKKGKR